MSQAGIVTVFVATSAWLVQVVTKSSLEFALSLWATRFAGQGEARTPGIRLDLWIPRPMERFSKPLAGRGMRRDKRDGGPHMSHRGGPGSQKVLPLKKGGCLEQAPHPPSG